MISRTQMLGQPHPINRPFAIVPGRRLGSLTFRYLLLAAGLRHGRRSYAARMIAELGAEAARRIGGGR